MANVLVKIVYGGGGTEKVEFKNTTPAAVKTDIEAAKAAGTLLQVGNDRLINVDLVGSWRLIQR